MAFKNIDEGFQIHLPEMVDFSEDFEMLFQPRTCDERSRELDQTASEESLNLDDSEQGNRSTFGNIWRNYPPSSPAEITSIYVPSFTNSRMYHALCYVYFINPNHRVPDIVIERLTEGHMKNMRIDINRKRAVKFFEDINIDSAERMTSDDYQDSIYDKGHLAAASNHKYNRDAYESTFCLSNTAPMHKKVNRGFEKLEKLGQSFAEQKEVFIYTSPYFNPDRDPVFVNENSRLPVPDAFIKVFAFKESVKKDEPSTYQTKQKYFVHAYMVENKPDIVVDLISSRIALEDLRAKIGSNFLQDSCNKCFEDAIMPRRRRIG